MAMMDVRQLVEAVRQGGGQGEEASLVLGLLIERERVRRPIARDEGGIGQILDKEYADRRLSEDELAAAVEGLLRHVAEADEDVEPSTVWALGKSNEPRVVPPLVDLLLRLIERPEKEDLAYQTLLAVVNIGIGSSFQGPALEAVRAAARRGSGRVAETARDYLDAVV
jgi:hypothetical protein